MEDSMRVVGIVGGNFAFQKRPDGTEDKTRVVCVLCMKAFAYHRSSSSLTYHIRAKHPGVLAAAASVSSDYASHYDALHHIKLGESATYVGQPASVELTMAIAKWIATDCRPIDIVEDEGLMEVLRTASSDAWYRPPRRTIVASIISNMYDREKKHKFEVLMENLPDCVAITGDHWTSDDNHSHLEVTGHFIDSEWKLNSLALAVMSTETSQFADKCAEQLLGVANNWWVEHKISTTCTSREGDVGAAMKALPYQHIACNALILQRSITAGLESGGFGKVLEKCRKIVGRLRQTPANITVLDHQQQALGEAWEQLPEDVPGRWGSTLAMISSLLQNRHPVQTALEQQDPHKVVTLTAEEWGQLQRLQLLLEPCKDVIQLLGGEAYVPCSVVLPTFCHLDRVMNIADGDPDDVVNFKNAFKKELAAQRADANDTWFEVATALDPRFKDMRCLPRPNREQVWTGLQSILQASEPRRATLPNSTPKHKPAEKKRKSLLLLDSDSDEDVKECGELERYRAEPSIGIEDCPLQWWSAHAGAYRKLSVLARKYLASPATSVPCDRLFSLQGHIVQRKREALLPQHVDKLICLGNWLKKK